MAAERWIPTLEDYVNAASFVLGASRESVRRLPRITLAESAVNAPFASFGGQAAYTDLADQAAVLLAHLVENHPLPDGNKRAAFLLMARFLDANGLAWKAQDVEVERRNGRACRRRRRQPRRRRCVDRATYGRKARAGLITARRAVQKRSSPTTRPVGASGASSNRRRSVAAGVAPSAPGGVWAQVAHESRYWRRRHVARVSRRVPRRSQGDTRPRTPTAAWQSRCWSVGPLETRCVSFLITPLTLQASGGDQEPGPWVVVVEIGGRGGGRVGWSMGLVVELGRCRW